MPSPGTQGLLQLSDQDNCYVITRDLRAGERIRVGTEEWVVPTTLGIGHKIAAADIPMGATVVKFGAPIGVTTAPIKRFEHIHLHNLTSIYIPTHERGKFSSAERES
jgi:hypothetical protein